MVSVHSAVVTEAALPAWLDHSLDVDVSDPAFRQFVWLPGGLEARPVVAAGSVAAPVGDQLVVTGPEAPRALVLDPVSRELWSWFDGGSTISEMAEDLRHVESIASAEHPRELAESLVAGLVRVLAEHRLLEAPLEMGASPVGFPPIPPDS